MTDYLKMTGKDALTIEEAEELLYHRACAAYHRACNKLDDAISAAKKRRDTREGKKEKEV